MKTTTRYFCAATAVILAMLTGCATPGAPLPPSLNLPKAVDDLAVARKGNRVLLTWTPPTSTTDRTAIRNQGVTRICRVVNEYPMNSCGAVVKELRPNDLPSVSAESQRQQVMFEDVVPANLLKPDAMATYAVEVLNDRGRSAGLSNQTRISLAPTLPAPTVLNAQVTAQGVTLTWNTPILSEVPGVAYRYRVWRRLAGKGEYTQVEEVPAKSTEMRLLEPSFDWEQTYEYKVAPVTKISPQGRQPFDIEGEDSPVVRVYVHDVFPPAQPTGLQAVFSSVGQKPFVDLTWDPSMEADVAGYDVFRSAAGDAGHKLNHELLKAPSFRDSEVRPGVTYTYWVQAVDLRGNRSTSSAATSESVPR